MSEDKISLINLVPEALDNAAKNLTDKPTQNAGTTLADIWYLVFGGISQAAEKRKIKYSYALQEFEKELKEKISEIPKDKKVEPDMQIVAPALEASKYCIEREELRHIFSSLVSASLTNGEYVPPMLIDIAKKLSIIDVKILNYLYQYDKEYDYLQLPHLGQHLGFFDIDDYLDSIQTPIVELEQMNLICRKLYQKRDEQWIIKPSTILEKYSYNYNMYLSSPDNFEKFELTPLGKKLCELCK